MTDSGGTHLGGSDTSQQTLLINVLPVNDQPRFEFARGASLVILEGSVASIPFLTNISAGRCELEQAMTFSVTPVTRVIYHQAC